MADIEVVIKIDEDIYNRFTHNEVRPRCEITEEERFQMDADAVRLTRAFCNGISLPKGHSNLKDELDLDLFAPSLGTDEYINDLMAKHNIDYVNGDDEDKVRTFAMDLIHGCMNVIKTAPTIIEADKKSEEKE